MPANYVLLQRTTLTQDSASVVLDGIPPSGYTDLKLVISARGSYAGEVVAIRVNPNSQTANMTSRIMYGTGTAVDKFGDTIAYGNIPASTATANTFGVFEFHIFNYLSATAKGFLGEGYTGNRSTAALTVFSASRWNDNTTISSLQIAATTGNLVTGSEFSLYGLVNTTTTPVFSPFASGGDLIDSDGTYWYHAFLSSGTFTPFKALTADILVVAGGGSGASGGNSAGAGGGGAGGLLAFTSQALTPLNYNCIVGGGGAARALTGGAAQDGFVGNDSQFASLTLVKGGGFGGGGLLDGVGGNGGTGGSGGGAGRWSNATSQFGGSPTTGQGFKGGDALSSGAGGRNGVGGGGAGGAGVNRTNVGDGDGGIGSSAYSSWGLATNTGQNSSGTVYYAGGGGGSGVANLGAGGLGGGGAGPTPNGSAQTATSGIAGTGGGGGGMGGADAAVLKTSGAGGSGIVIVRYPMV